MRPKSSTPETPFERLIRDIRRGTRKYYSAEEKIRIVLEGLRGDATIAGLCRREGIALNRMRRIFSDVCEVVTEHADLPCDSIRLSSMSRDVTAAFVNALSHGCGDRFDIPPAKRALIVAMLRISSRNGPMASRL
jgi:hypothetical protein